MNEGMLQMKNGHPVYGSKIYGAPIGDADFINKAITVNGIKIISEIKQVETRLNPSLFPETQLPIKQCLWLLTMRCLQHLGNYLCCHVSPQLTLDFSKSLDDGICDCVATLTDTV
eukprot:15366397-Ditylum_brightwellii.AAC.2